MNNINTAVAPKSPNPVAEALGRNRSLLEDLEGLIITIYNRLDPVLVPEAPEPGGKAGVELKIVAAPLVEEISQLSEVLTGNLGQLRKILNRLVL